jgi:O-antigen/teichoic acid export membrane protein
MSHGRRFAKNTMWNLVGQVAPLAIAIVAVPIVLRALGKERFGILTLAWAAVGYFNIFDFGLPRVLTQAISPAVDVGDRTRLATVSQSGLLIMAVMGLVGGILMAALTPWLVNTALNVPTELKAEATRSFFLLSACVPFVVTTSGLRGLFEAHQDFGVATILRLPYAAFNYVAPLVAITFSHSLVPVVALLLLGRILTWVAHVIVCYRRYAYLRAPVPFAWSNFPPLMKLGGWMTASGVISPLMYNIDRFIIGSRLSLAAVTYYVTPFELVTKLTLIPTAIIGVLFPAYAAAHVQDSSRATDLLERTIRLMGIIMFPGVILVVAFAPEILRLWVGAEMAREGSRVAQWLAIGVFVNSIAQVPFTVLQASGRPDITAKLHAIELPVYAGAFWLFTRQLGVNGVAAAWVLRMAVDATLLTVIVARRYGSAQKVLSSPIRIGIVLCAAAAVPMLFESLVARASIAALILAIAAVAIWQRGLRGSERKEVIRLVRLPFASTANAA